jgi:periplasmic protein TonB
MQTMSVITAAPRRVTPQRATGLLFAGLLQVALVWALIEGLNIKVWPEPDHGIEGRVIIDKTKLPPLPPPRTGVFVDPGKAKAILPIIDIDDGQVRDPITIVHPGGNATADVPAAGIAVTHTIPPYPLLAIRLEEQGAVQLRLVISAQGMVTDAVIVRSSGFQDLDQAARAWVMAHWRYRPAMRGGVAVPSAADALVRFDLRNAG